jgi:hypothetical protein
VKLPGCTDAARGESETTADFGGWLTLFAGGRERETMNSTKAAGRRSNTV